MSADENEMKAKLEGLLQEARDGLAHAEGVAAMVPELRRNVRVLERSIGQLRGGEAPRPKGPTIRESIVAALQANDGTITFGPGQMLATIHDIVGGKRGSVQVEISRQEKLGRLRITRDGESRPVAMSLVAPPAPAEGRRLAPVADLQEG